MSTLLSTIPIFPICACCFMVLNGDLLIVSNLYVPILFQRSLQDVALQNVAKAW